MLCNVDKRKEYVKKTYSLEDNIINMLIESDPTRNKKYVSWLAKLYNNGNIRLPEDINKLRETLEYYIDALRLNLNVARDINRYKTYGELYQELEPYMKNVDEDREYSEMLEYAFSNYTVYNDGEYRVVKVDNSLDDAVEIVMILASGSGWCVKYIEETSSYLKGGNLYFIYKGDKRFALYSDYTHDLLDVYDKPLDINSLSEVLNVLLNVSDPSNILNIISNDTRYIEYDIDYSNILNLDEDYYSKIL